MTNRMNVNPSPRPIVPLRHRPFQLTAWALALVAAPLFGCDDSTGGVEPEPEPEPTVAAPEDAGPGPEGNPDVEPEDAGPGPEGNPEDAGPGPEGNPDVEPEDAGPGPEGNPEDAGPGPEPEPTPVVAAGPTKGGTVAINESGDTLAVANKDTGDVTLFELPGMTERARIATGGEPSSVSFDANNEVLYVVNRADASVVKVTAADTASPVASAPLLVGAEASRGALSPSGATLYVTNWAEGTVSIVDTATMTIRNEIATGGAPFAICITNDGDNEDGDEKVFVTDFYSRAAESSVEGTDDAREGRIFRLTPGSDVVESTTLAAVASSGIAGFEDTGMYPNQLYGCTIEGDSLYVTAVGASPAAFNGGTDFHQNLQGLLHVVDVNTGLEDPAQTLNLNTLVEGLAAPKRFVPVPSDIAFVPGTTFAYVTSLVSNSVLRLDFASTPPAAGSPSGASFLETAPAPTGIAISNAVAYTNNEVARGVSVIDLAAQVTTDVNVASAPAPADVQGQRENIGKKFFYTGLARWSTNGWVGCVGCHPFGTTDNVTWVFPAGPRQTVDTSATFNLGGTKQRILNWTAIFDEVHDFELNTRGVAGGTGAIVNDTALNANGTANLGVRIDFVGAGGVGDPVDGFNLGSAKAAAAAGAVPNDWDEIEAFIQSIRSPNGRIDVDGDSAAGRAVFEEGRCQNCHGGPLWTLSERYYTPLGGVGNDERLLSLFDVGVSDIGLVRADQVRSTDVTDLKVLENDANGPPARHTCVVRNVGTFDNAGEDNRGAAELRQNGNAAQGVDGFNIPSLLGIGMGAPFLHHGAAETLEDLLDPNGSFATHLRAGNQVFAPSATDIADLAAFLRSIDDATPTIAVPAGHSFCPTDVTQ